MQSYTEAQLQAYVETHLERDLHQWCGDVPGDDLKHVEILGSQVSCATGIMDILATVNYLPLIIELKAVTATEKVIGQITRYKAEVRSTFFHLCLDVEMSMSMQTSVLRDWRERHSHLADEVETIVIAPSYDPACVHGIGHVSRPLIAQLDDAGDFHIFPLPFEGHPQYPGMTSPHVRDLLCRVAFNHVGASMARTWSDNYADARNKHDNPQLYYRISEA